MKSCIIKDVSENQLVRLHHVSSILDGVMSDDTSVEYKDIVRKVSNALMDLFISVGPNYDIYTCVDNNNIPSYLIVVRGKKRNMILLQGI